MYKRQGLGIAMGNAPEGVKETANLVTTSNDEHGVAPVSYTHLDVYKRQIFITA